MILCIVRHFNEIIVGEFHIHPEQFTFFAFYNLFLFKTSNFIVNIYFIFFGEIIFSVGIGDRSCDSVIQIAVISFRFMTSFNSVILKNISSISDSTTGVTKPWNVLSCLWDGAYKRTLAVNRKE